MPGRARRRRNAPARFPVPRTQPGCWRYRPAVLRRFPCRRCAAGRRSASADRKRTPPESPDTRRTIRLRASQILAQGVSAAAMGDNGLAIGPDGAQLCANVLDVRVDRAIKTGVRLLPDQVHQLLAGEDVASAFDELPEDVELVFRQVQRGP